MSSGAVAAAIQKARGDTSPRNPRDNGSRNTRQSANAASAKAPFAIKPVANAFRGDTEWRRVR